MSALRGERILKGGLRHAPKRVFGQRADAVDVIDGKNEAITVALAARDKAILRKVPDVAGGF